MAEYVCEDCGSQIALADSRCLGCGSAHPHAIEERPYDEPEANLTRGSIGFWALGAVLFLAFSVIAISTSIQAG